MAVSVGVYFLDVTAIDDVSQSFSAQMILAVGWREPRLAESHLGRSLAGCRILLADIWEPRVGILNQLNLTSDWDEMAEIDGDGNVEYRQRILGRFSSPVDLRDFPFDTQSLPITVAGFRAGQELDFHADPRSTGRLEDFSLSGWEVELAEPALRDEYIATQARSVSVLDFRLRARRNVGFYIYKVVIPLSLIVLMAWTVFWIDPVHMAPQVGVSTASVLTLIAFQFSLIQLLPRLSYLTRMDRFLLASTLLVFGALGTSILTGRLALDGREGTARRIDRWARGVYLALFAAVIVRTLGRGLW